MRKLIALSLVLGILGCKTKQVQESVGTNASNEEVNKSVATTTKSEEIMLIGQITKSELQKVPYSEWFNVGEKNYIPKNEDLTALKSYGQDYKIKIFMGTWCGDSKEQIPRFYKILKQINFDLRKTTLIAVDRKKNTPDNLEKDLNITHVPTFIFYKKGKEIHRIVETPVVSLENDMLKIITGQPYMHIYKN